MSGSGIQLIDRAADFADKTAIVDADGTFSYEHLSNASAQAATLLLRGSADLREARVAFLVPSGFS
jgi:malonyl-CoA/methylmalonyl-CoA synthetase